MPATSDNLRLKRCVCELVFCAVDSGLENSDTMGGCFYFFQVTMHELLARHILLWACFVKFLVCDL